MLDLGDALHTEDVVAVVIEFIVGSRNVEESESQQKVKTLNNDIVCNYVKYYKIKDNLSKGMTVSNRM